MGGGAGFTPVPTNSYRVDGARYDVAKQDVNPFRTVEGAGQYGTGLNASAGQLATTSIARWRLIVKTAIRTQALPTTASCTTRRL